MAGSITRVCAGALTTVTFANACKRNAIDVGMWRALCEHFEHLQALPASDASRAIIVRGADGHFASGGDIVEFADLRFDEQRLHAFHESIVAPALHAILDAARSAAALSHGDTYA